MNRNDRGKGKRKSSRLERRNQYRETREGFRRYMLVTGEKPRPPLPTAIKQENLSLIRLWPKGENPVTPGQFTPKPSPKMPDCPDSLPSVDSAAASETIMNKGVMN